MYLKPTDQLEEFFFDQNFILTFNFVFLSLWEEFLKLCISVTWSGARFESTYRLPPPLSTNIPPPLPTLRHPRVKWDVKCPRYLSRERMGGWFVSEGRTRKRGLSDGKVDQIFSLTWKERVRVPHVLSTYQPVHPPTSTRRPQITHLRMREKIVI